MKYQLLVLIVLGFSLPSFSATTVIFGPQKFSAGLLKPKETEVVVNGPVANRDGVLTITNGDGRDLEPVVCSGNLVQKVLCLLGNVERRLISELQRPEKPEIYFNGVLLASKANLPQTKGKLQIPVKLQLKNNLKVRLQGVPTSYLAIDVKTDSVVPNQIPVARIGATPTTGIAPELISFSGLTSSDPDGDVITSYSWEFGDNTFASGALVTHNYANAGTYAVKLTVTDSKGGAGSVTNSVVIKQNQLPLANFSSVVNADLGILNIQVDGASSQDPDGSGIIEYLWNFGDTTSASGVTASHVYSQPGTYTISLTVKDSKNGTGTISKSVLVKDSVPPVLLSLSPAPNTDLPGFQIPVSGQSNEPLSTVSVNGTNLTLSADQKSFSGVFVSTIEGPQSLSLSATDLAGNTSMTSVSISITPPNTAPVAALDASPRSGNIPFTVQFTAEGSTDAQNNIVSYFWDFGDGTFQTTSTPVISHSYSKNGDLFAVVTVTDTKGLNSSASVNLFGNTPPIAKFTANPSSGTAPFLVTFDSSQSSDPENRPIAEYRWNFGDNTSFSSQNPTATHTYQAVGSYTATLTVLDSEGSSHSTEMSIVASEPSDNQDEEASSNGIIAASGLDPKVFNPISGTLVLTLSGAKFSADPSSIQILVGDEVLSKSQISMSSDFSRVTLSLNLQDGKNELSLQAQDDLGQSLIWEETYWAGSRTAAIHLVDPSGQALGNTDLLAYLSDDSSIGISQVGVSSDIQLSNIPAAQDVILVARNGSSFGLSRMKPNQSAATVVLDPIHAPSPIANNDLSQGTAGWDIQGTAAIVNDINGKHLDTIGVAGTSVQVRRTFLVSEDGAYNVNFQLVPQSANDSYTISLRTASGHLAFLTGLASDIQSAGSATLSTMPWKSLSIQTEGAGDIVELSVSANFASNLTSSNPFINMLLPTQANAATAGLRISPMLLSSIFIKDFNLYDYKSFYQVIPATDTDEEEIISNKDLVCSDDNIADSGVLSMGPIPADDFGGRNILCGKLDFARNKSSVISVQYASLELVNTNTPDTLNLSNCQPVGSPIQMDLETKTALTNSLNSVGSGVFGTTGNNIMFTIPSAPTVSDFSFNLRLKLLISERWLDGSIVNRCLTETIYKKSKPVNFRPIISFGTIYPDSSATVKNRFSPHRDGDSESLTPFNQGGDDWGRPHISTFLDGLFGTSARTPGLFQTNKTNVTFNDISNMNGGFFPPHDSHRTGVSIDLRSDHYFDFVKMMSAAGAEDVIYNMWPFQLAQTVPFNLSAQVNKVLVTYVQETPDDTDPGWQVIRTACIGDGRSARSRVRHYKGHKDHFHFDFNQNPEDYHDFRPDAPPAPDFGFDATATGVTKFTVINPQSGYDYGWEIRDLAGKVIRNADKFSPTFTGDTKTVQIPLPVGEYTAKLVAFKKLATGNKKIDGSETCSQVKKRIYVYDSPRCEGKYGTSYVNPDNTIGAFMEIGTSALPYSNPLIYTPFLDRDSDICGTSKILGNVQIFGSTLKGHADVSHNVEIRNKSIVKDAKINYLITNLLNHLTVTQAAEIDGDLDIGAQPTMASNNIIGGTIVGLDGKGAKVKGKGKLQNASIFSPWRIEVDNIQMTNSYFLGATATKQTISGVNFTALNSSLTGRDSLINGSVNLNNTALTVPLSIDGNITMNNVTANSASSASPKLVITGNAVLTNVRFPQNLTWDFSHDVNNASCASFYFLHISPAVDGYALQTPALGTQACRQPLDNFNVYFGLLDQYSGPTVP